jgi:hypothetical protein
VKALLTVVVAGVLLGSTVFVDSAEAGNGKGHKRGHYRAGGYYGGYSQGAHYRGPYYRGRYFRGPDVVVIRDYYRPYYRPVPAVVHYYPGHYLPPGWRTRIVPVPVYLEPRLVHVPYGYQRGIIDAHAVIYNSRGLIIDVAALF